MCPVGCRLVLNQNPTLVVTGKMLILPTNGVYITFFCVGCISVSLLGTHISFMVVYCNFVDIEEQSSERV